MLPNVKPLPSSTGEMLIATITTSLFWYALEEADSVDLLGLTLNNDLSWNQEVTKMSRTAGQSSEELVLKLYLPREPSSIRPWYNQKWNDLALEVPRSNLVSHARSFRSSTAQLLNSLSAQIPVIRSRASFSREVKPNLPNPQNLFLLKWWD